MARKKTNGNNRDIEELESTFRKLSDPKKKKTGKYAAKKSFSWGRLIIILLMVCILVGTVAGFFAFRNFSKNQQISAKVSIAGLDITGMTRQEAVKAVEEHFRSRYQDKDLVVNVQDQSLALPYSKTKVSLDAAKAVDAALNFNGMNPEVTSLDVSGFISVDTNTVLNLIQPLINEFSDRLVQTSYKFIGKKPEYYDKIDPNATTTLQIIKGQPGIRLDPSLLMTEIKNAYSNGAMSLDFACPYTEPNEVDWEQVYQLYSVFPIDATIDEETFQITEGSYGYGFTVEEVEVAVAAADYGETINIPFQWIEPEHTAEELGEMLFRDVLATYTTKASSDYSRNINLRLAAEACNGIILYPGDVFSFNKTLGERTPEKGYQPAASYVGGQTVYDYGGGICQVATTIYYCAVVSDLKIVERAPHGYASAYTPLSTDAAVFWQGVDFRFKNNTEYPIRIEASANKGNVTVSLVGTDTKDYYVKFEWKHLDTIPYETVYEEMAADNEKGYKDGDVIVTPYTGYQSQGFRAKYSKETDKLIERILESTDTYSFRNKVICKIVATETPTEPTEPPTIPVEPTIPPDPTESEAPSTETPPTEIPPTEAPSTQPSTEAPPTTDPSETLPDNVIDESTP